MWPTLSQAVAAAKRDHSIFKISYGWANGCCQRWFRVVKGRGEFTDEQRTQLDSHETWQFEPEGGRLWINMPFLMPVNDAITNVLTLDDLAKLNE